MNETLADFIMRRKGELALEVASLQQQIDVRHNELAQLRAAAEAANLVGVFESVEAPDQVLVSVPVETTRRRLVSERTIKEAVVEVLKGNPDGFTALEILSAINLRFGFDYPRTSLSPQLSRLKKEGVLIRDGRNWRLHNLTDTLGEILQSIGPIRAIQKNPGDVFD